MGAIRAALVDAVVAALPVALVYFSGWAYLTSYLGEFGIDATQIDISFTTVLVYAFVPLQSSKVLWMIVAVGASGFAAFLIELHSDDKAKTGQTWASGFVVLTMILLVCLLFVIKGAATAAGQEMAHDVWGGRKSQSVMTLSASKPEDDASVLYEVCRKGRRLRQIIGLPDQMFLMCRSAADPCNRGTLFAVSKDGRIVYTADKIREDIDVIKTVCTS
ncbi:hypothetical protein [Mesorhizobium neociceri]|uniref:Uncharacterized protein n=1 Tax=Mesorhizobium neociceri TaxID=1307853 RepID=A0A838B089_9HYPH|nr:hypothetical protein [Mesorhizobium neociceri]MBA1140248.1 hypothetical protein [Mesorhizobium neociceri]